MTIVQSIYGYCYFMCTKEQLQSCIWHILLALHRVGEWMLCAFLEQICMSRLFEMLAIQWVQSHHFW